MSELLLDDLADALGRVVADVKHEWRKDVDRISAESRAIIAELRSEVLALKYELKAAAEEQHSRLNAAIAQVKDGEPGRDGKDGRDGLDGKDADPELITRLVADAVAAIPLPQDGKDGRDGADGVNGKDADPETVAKMVASAIDAIPRPENGKDADPALVASLVAFEVEKAISALPKPQDGRDGRDGLPGLPGEKGRDGVDGVNGQDGLGIDNFDVTYDGERTFTLRWANQFKVEERSFVLPLVLDQGVYKAGEAYRAGDAVTWGGSLWIAQEPTTEKPDSGKGWRLAVKRGRDGKDGKREGGA